MTKRSKACLLPLAFSSHSPERAQAEPRKRNCEADCNGQASAPNLPRMILVVFLHRGSGEAERHHKEQQSRYFQPEHVSGSGEGAAGRSDCTHKRIQSAAAAGLIAHNPRCSAQFTKCRNFAHALDFNSLAALQWPNVAVSEPFRRSPHLIK